MASRAINNIALVGAGGNMGSLVLKNLLESPLKYSITIVSRLDSKSTFPEDPAITIKAGSYDSDSFLASAFSGIDAVVLALHFDAIPGVAIRLIKAAAAAGVKWIFPPEFGSDTGNEVMINIAPIHSLKVGIRNAIEEIAKDHQGLKWVGVVTNPWLDWSLQKGMYEIDIPNRKATLLSGGTAKFNTTNLSTAALSIVRLLGLPITSSSGPSLSDYGNRLVYISSFRTSQREILDSVQRVTGTRDSDWTITNRDTQEYIEEGAAKIARGDLWGMANVLYGSVMKGDMGGDYESARGLSNTALGLPKEDLDESVRAALQAH